MTQEEIRINNAKVEKQMYVILWIINCLLLFTTAVTGIGAIYNVFQANWPYAIGFFLVAFISHFIFRRIPWPETSEAKRKRQERMQLLETLSRFSR